MKKNYISAAIEITALDINDVITASNVEYVDGDNSGGNENGISIGDMFTF